MDLSQYNLGQLKQLHEDVSKEVAKREKAERQQAIDQIYQLAHQFNIPLKSLLSQDAKKTRKPTSPPAVIYRDPNNPESTWTGRGKRPTWLSQAVANGANIDNYRVSAHH